MKKIIFTLIAFICFFGIANAKEYCTVISGTGENIGDEIACGSEHFYVMNVDGENIKMLSKYNLYVGANYDKIKLDIDTTYMQVECTGNWCSKTNGGKFFFEGTQVNDYQDWLSHIYEKYNLTDLSEIWDNNGNYQSDGSLAVFDYIYGDKIVEDNITYEKQTYKIYPYTTITDSTKGYAMQNELALGVYGEKGNANYPIYATLILFPLIDNFKVSEYIDDYENYKNGYTNFEFKANTTIKNYLNDYRDNLTSKGYSISKVDMINIEELNDLIHSITNEDIPLVEWYNASLNNDMNYDDSGEYIVLGDLKELLPDKYSWIWNTSYWTKTIVGNDLNMNGKIYNYKAYFVASNGEICYSESDCFSGIPRAGIRPVVTISKGDIMYSIETKTDGNGEIKVETVSAKGGDIVKFTIEPKEGYVLGEVKVTDANGNVLTFTDNTFTMPNANVLIEATFLVKNAKTADLAIGAIVVLFVISLITVLILSTKKKKEIKN